jgi:uncharacterized protein (TIGR02118 family)
MLESKANEPDEPGSHRLGSAMIAAVSLMRRLDTVDPATFRRHWLDVHGPLVCRFAGLRRYTQCHVLEQRVAADWAHASRIDGFPLLFFGNDQERRRAHGSPEMAACNVDSEQFIGAVSRVITQPVEVVPRSASAGPIGLMILYPERSDTAAIEAHLADLGSQSKLRGLTRYRVLDQGPAPNSSVPHLAVAVGLIAQAWFDTMADVQIALAVRNEADSGAVYDRRTSADVTVSNLGQFPGWR